MSNLINNIIEPSRLLMIWQELDKINEVQTGRRYIVGEILRDDDQWILRYFSNRSDYKEALDLGFEGFSIFPIAQETHKNNVKAVLERRIPPRERGDFDDFLRYHRIEPKVGREIVSDFALLGYTGGKLPGDNLSFVHTFEDAVPPCEITIEVAGVRHYTKIDELRNLLGCSVRFIEEPDNQYDPEAIRIETKDTFKMIGYINRAQTETFHSWLSSSENYEIKAVIERVNGTLSRPSVLLFVQVSKK